MTLKEDATKAGLRASWTAWVEREGSEYGWPDSWDDLEQSNKANIMADAEIGLDASLSVLFPTIPNEVEVINKLPVGTVLRGKDLLKHTVIMCRESSAWWVGMFDIGTSDAYIEYFKRGTPLSRWRVSVNEWQVIHRG